MYRILCFMLISLCCGGWGLEAGAQSPATGSLRYGLEWNYQEMNLSAILVLKEFGEEKKGVIMNEFGINLLEFDINKKGKVAVAFLHPMLRRPFVKKLLRKDLRLLNACLEAPSVDDVPPGWRKGVEITDVLDENNSRLLKIQHHKPPMSIVLFGL